MPEKSGMDVALSSSVPADPTVGAAACPKAGVTTAAASVNIKGKFRHCESIAFLPSSSRSSISLRLTLHLLRLRLKVVVSVLAMSVLGPNRRFKAAQQKTRSKRNAISRPEAYLSEHATQAPLARDVDFLHGRKHGRVWVFTLDQSLRRLGSVISKLPPPVPM
jgi:hypothetical protein